MKRQENIGLTRRVTRRITSGKCDEREDEQVIWIMLDENDEMRGERWNGDKLE